MPRKERLNHALALLLDGDGGRFCDHALRDYAREHYLVNCLPEVPPPHAGHLHGAAAARRELEATGSIHLMEATRDGVSNQPLVRSFGSSRSTRPKRLSGGQPNLSLPSRLSRPPPNTLSGRHPPSFAVSTDT